MSTFQTKKNYSFQVYPSGVLGTSNFQKVTVLAILDYESALQFADVQAMHENVLPFLPTGTPDRPQDFDYLLIKTVVGKTVVGVPWIVPESIELAESLKMEIVLEDVSTNDVIRVRECLSQNGYNNISIRLI